MYGFGNRFYIVSGILEWWNGGTLGLSKGFPDKRPPPAFKLFDSQYSIVPSFQSVFGMCLSVFLQLLDKRFHIGLGLFVGQEA